MHATRTRRRSVRRGFSLIELLVAIAILLAIGAVVGVALLPKKGQADIDLTRGQIDQFVNAIKLFQLDMGRYPSEEEGLSVLWAATNLEDEEEEAKWKGPYFETPRATDAWGNEWVYMNPSEEREDLYEIKSLGPDGEEDTEDDISSLDRFRSADGELDESFEDFSMDGGSEDGG